MTKDAEEEGRRKEQGVDRTEIRHTDNGQGRETSDGGQGRGREWIYSSLDLRWLYAGGTGFSWVLEKMLEKGANWWHI